jgi:putative CocE/NonD family hydrolase
VDILRDQTITARDGVGLATDVYLPRGASSPLPTIVTRLPYGKNEDYCSIPPIGRFWARKGYAYTVQDVRGKWASEGDFDANNNGNEIRDGHDTIEWITRQSWSNGQVGAWGESYYGFTSYASAVSQHPALACIAPGNVSLDRYRSTFRNGALQLNTIGNWAISMVASQYQDISVIDPWHLPLAEIADAAGCPSTYFDGLIENPTRTSFWEERSLLEALQKVRIPVLHWGGWYDNYLGPVILDWLAFRDANPGNQHNYLFIGPWDHEGTADDTGRAGRLDVGTETARHRWDTYQAFFDRHLMGIHNGFDEKPPIQIFVMGDNRWCYEEAWPPPSMQTTRLYLHSRGRANSLHGDGILSHELPASEPVDSYVYDPRDPVADTLIVNCWAIAAEMKDRRNVEARRDVLVYTTAALERDMELTGNPSRSMGTT